MRYQPQHAANPPHSPPRGRVVSVGAAVVAFLLATLMSSPAQAQTAESHTSRAAATVVVTVASGNSMWGLASSWCGAAALWPQIHRANPAVRNPHLIYLGQRLTIPCALRGADRATRSTTRTAPPAASGWVHPLPGAVCTSGWGAPRAGHSHHGLDFPRPSGTPIRAAAAGTVALVRYQGGGAGHYVAIHHGGGVHTVYMHLRARTPLAVGARVSAGQTIGQVGATGNAKGPHLHFEVHRGLWEYTNPAPFMRARGVNVGC